MFEWDPEKELANIRKHGIGFDEATQIFGGFTLNFVDDQREHNDLREVSIGLINGLTIVTIVHTDRDGVCRIISARRANKGEKKRYEEALQQSTYH